MPKRLRNQWRAKQERRERRERLQRLKISHRRVRKSQVSTQSVSASATATKPQDKVKTHKLVLTKGPDDSYDRSSWITSIMNVLNKTRNEAQDIIYAAEFTEEKPTLFSSADLEEITSFKRSLAWSLRDATKIKE